MDILGVSTSEPLEVKWQCKNCPRLIGLQGKLDELDKQKDNISSAAQSPGVQKLVENSSVGVLDVSTGATTEVAPEQLLAMLRTGAAEHLEHLDSHEQECRDEGNSLQNNCPGTTDLHTKDVVGRTVVASVCGSPIAGSSGIEPAHITRTFD